MKIQEYYLYFQKKRIQQEERLSKRKTLLFIVDFPLRFILDATIPPSDEEEYDHKLLTVWPLFGGAFLYYNFWDHLVVKNPNSSFIFIPILVLL